MGFSPLGLLVSAAVLAPNLLLLAYPPRAPAPAVRVPAPLVWLERTGQAACLVVPAATRAGDLAWGWMIPTAIALLVSFALWGRYLARGRRVAHLFDPVARIPVPLAIIPVVVFLCASAWLGNPWIALAAVVLAAGHVPVALHTARAVVPR